MVNQIYPRVEINLGKLKHNVSEIVKRCGDIGIDIAGVIKGTTGIVECADMYVEGGAKLIASSRLEQLEDCIEHGITLPLLMLRVPMLSEVPEVIRLTDYSLNSEPETIRALNEEAGKQGKKHNIILMADLGDLREGFWDHDEMVEVAVDIENNMDIGITSNFPIAVIPKEKPAAHSQHIKIKNVGFKIVTIGDISI